MDTYEFVEYHDWLYRTTRNDIMRDLILETILLMDLWIEFTCMIRKETKAALEQHFVFNLVNAPSMSFPRITSLPRLAHPTFSSSLNRFTFSFNLPFKPLFLHCMAWEALASSRRSHDASSWYPLHEFILEQKTIIVFLKSRIKSKINDLLVSSQVHSD